MGRPDSQFGQNWAPRPRPNRSSDKLCSLAKFFSKSGSDRYGKIRPIFYTAFPPIVQGPQKLRPFQASSFKRVGSSREFGKEKRFDENGSKVKLDRAENCGPKFEVTERVVTAITNVDLGRR